jgi:hypothetical protein
MDNGDIYLFYRHGAHRSDWVYQKSTDNGRTFNEPVSFLKHKRRTDQAAEDSWYPWITKGQGDDLIVAFDYHLCRDNNNNNNNKTWRGHIPQRYNLYYMVMDTKTGAWRNVKSEPLTMPLTKEEADKKTLVTRTDGNWTFQGIVDLDEAGNPTVGVMIGKDIGKKRSALKRIHLFRWNGEAWRPSANRGIPIGNGDLAVKSTNEVSLYLESNNKEDVGEVSRWDSFNGGDTFKQATVFLSRKNSSFVISSLIKNAHPDARMIVAEKEKGTDFRKMYLLGDNGPVKRLEKEVRLIIK